MHHRSPPILAVSLLLGTLVVSGPGNADEAVVRPLASTGSVIAVSNDMSSVDVTLDFARILSFSEPARTIVIGNPGIVDGTLNDEATLVLTGKAVGVTNMIVLGEAGRELASLRIQVLANSSQITTIYNGTAQQTYSCVDACRPIGKVAPEK
ncbi:pilus assembly protein N-terminal domain-containing protein [Microvirga sp. 2YAF29]|uniref:pilus assembly protein N-terminal domain-containing protein n=1 Tax=Microvirga sp. 2YAF29 TaxID=3233031 RepID=UPI003F9D7E60